MHLRNVTLAILAFSVFAFAFDSPLTDPAASVAGISDAYQVSYVAGLNIGDSYINITNSGASSVLRHPDNICVNVYAFDPSENLLACCSCLVTPDGLVNLGVDRDILANVAGGVTPTSAVIKILSTLPPSANIGCYGSAALASSATFATGMLVYRTTLHPVPTGYTATELKFSNADLSQAELNLLTAGCNTLNKSGAGACNSCRTGGI